MNSVTVKLSHINDKHHLHTFDEFAISFSRCKINYIYDSGLMKITLISQTLEVKKLFEIFKLQYELLFLNLGFFPRIVEYSENNTVHQCLPEKYTNLKCYKTNKNDVIGEPICEIKDLISKQTLKLYKDNKNKYDQGLMSLFYLKCEAYDTLLKDHKHSILLQMCCGYSEIFKGIRNGIRKQLTVYSDKLKYLNTRYKIGIYKCLKTTKAKLPIVMEETRNKYGHYIKKAKALRDGEDFLYHYMVFEFIFRLMLLEDAFGISLSSTGIENLYIIHDWISDNRRLGSVRKSQRYKMIDDMTTVKAKLDELRNNK